jgi:hypothetical protein
MPNYRITFIGSLPVRSRVTIRAVASEAEAIAELNKIRSDMGVPEAEILEVVEDDDDC